MFICSLEASIIYIVGILKYSSYVLSIDMLYIFFWGGCTQQTLGHTENSCSLVLKIFVIFFYYLFPIIFFALPFSRIYINQIFGLLDCLILFFLFYFPFDFLLYFQENFNPIKVISAIIWAFILIIPSLYHPVMFHGSTIFSCLSKYINYNLLTLPIVFHWKYCLWHFSQIWSMNWLAFSLAQNSAGNCM